MSIKEIIRVPNPFLKVVAKPVIDINQNVLSLLNDMLETMYYANGIGLAATQIAIDKRLIVMDCGEVNFETEGLSEEQYDKKIKENFDLSPRGIREMLELNKPIYEKTAAYGHFGREPEDNGAFSCEKTNKTNIFLK